MIRTHMNQSIKIVIEIGKTMLVHGAETYRVEDSIGRMLDALGYKESNIFVVPTCIIITLETNEDPITYMERITPQSIDLEKIAKANQLSRDITLGIYSLDEAMDEIHAIERTPSFSRGVRYIGSAVAGGFFTLLFKGSLLSFGISAFASVLTVMLLDLASEKQLNFFIKNMLGGMFATLMGVGAAYVFKDKVEMGIIVLGPLMTLVPGVAFTNGIRDIITGELLAGATKMTEAVFIAIGIAFGVGFALKLVGEFPSWLV